MINKKYHLYLPPCGGLLNYWFGVINAIQDYDDKELINNLYFHTVSGSGFPVCGLYTKFNLKSVLLLWYTRLDYILGKYRLDYLYPLLKGHIFTTTNSSNINFKDVKHYTYFTSLKTMEIETWNNSYSYNNNEDYSEALTVSSFLPIIGLQLFYKNIKYGYVIDGIFGILYLKIKKIFNLTNKSFYKKIQENINKFHSDTNNELINCNRLLNYKSLNYKTLWIRRIMGLFYYDNEAYDAGYKDAKELLLPIITNKNKVIKKNLSWYNNLDKELNILKI